MISKQTLIEKLGLQDISNKDQLEILDKAADIILDRALLRLMNELNEEEARHLNELLNNNDQEKVAKALYIKFPNIDEIFDEEIENIKKELEKAYGE